MLALLEALGKIVLKQPGVVLHVHNPSTQQAEAGAPQVQVPPGLPRVSPASQGCVVRELNRKPYKAPL